MSDQEHEHPEKKEPPKIKLPGLSSMSESVKPGPADDASSTPPRMKVESTPSSGKTSRIEMSQAKPPAPVSGLPSGKTSRIEVSQARPTPPPAPGVKKQTTRIPLTETARSPDETLARKSQTTRIDVNQAKPPPATETGIREGLAKNLDSTLKRSTVRIEPEASRSAPPPTGIIEAEIPEAAKNVTQRIVLDDESAEPEAPPARPDPAAVQESKKRTSRIDLSSATMRIEADVLQRRVPPPAVAAPPPTTAPAVESPLARPKTIRISKSQVAPPGKAEPESAVTSPPTAKDIQEAKKSETARLDLPPDLGERPATRPKTIRIKRPDATPGRKPMAISRATDAGPARKSAAAAGDDEDGPGSLFTVLTIAAVLLAMVLIYVLAAQLSTVGAGHYDLPSWPFPGRLPG